MRRTINHTRKKRIPKKHVDITTIKKGGKIDQFRVDLDLKDLNLPEDGKVFVEAYRRFQWNRYDFGTIGDFGAREELDLGELAYSESLSFRVLVKDDEGMILAIANDVSPKEEEVVTPLLPVETDDIGQEIWNIEYMGTNGGPILVLNEKIPDVLEKARSDFQLILSVYPEVMRRVLSRIIYSEQDAETIDDLSEGWHQDWINLAKTLHPEGDPPKIIDPSDRDFRPVKAENWLDGVRKEFAAKRNKEWRNFIEWEKEGGLL